MTASKYTISGCTVADGQALAANNIPAFWEDPHWRLSWRHRTLEYHISQVTKRFPRNLLNDRETTRHQKVIDTETGRLIGYARWHIPPDHATLPDGTPAWPEAVIPAVSPEEEAELNRIAETAHWDPNLESDVQFEPVRAIKKPILARKPYMRLDYLAVHPDNQRKGAATALVQSGMRVAEKLGLDIFIHAMKAGVELYKRQGFRIEAELVQDDSMYGGTGEYYVCMMTYEQKSPSNVE
ncbi:hypothetical protein VMCG_04931 [Cytospora schulzeri]|uniref:N-acetyltransferase domain-containing protein n=1 Tax=Cytospora schulzeri TaxID=448051 RepID=A0A423WN90_9PEZI|nr:hypothetical protein VMCG_04931 [Valsa malicola]